MIYTILCYDFMKLPLRLCIVYQKEFFNFPENSALQATKGGMNRT